MTLTQIVAGTLGVKDESGHGWVPAYMQFSGSAPTPYPPEVARDIRTALHLHLLTQSGFEELGMDDVNASLKRLKEVN